MALPLRWLDRVRLLFESEQLPITVFSGSGGGFLMGEFHEFAAKRRRLLDALERGSISDLCLQSMAITAGSVSDWDAMAFVCMSDGLFYVGLGKHAVPSPGHLLSRACNIAMELFSVRYGIGYIMPSGDEPGGYAMGTTAYRISDVKEFLNSTRGDIPVASWADEVTGARRHLRGYFRGAYPASVLSESHVRRAALQAENLGKLSPLGGRLWLWELSAAEIPKAERILDRAGVLIPCATGERGQS